jgi:Circadian oscillating protein COP23
MIRRSILLSLCWVAAGFYLVLPARSQSNKQFYCGRSTADVPILYLQLAEKNRTIPLIAWKHPKSSGVPNIQLHRQCEITVTNFQQASKQDQLQYFTTAIVDEQLSICGSRTKTAPCNIQSQLFSLIMPKKPKQILGKLTQAFQGKTISPIIITFQRNTVQRYQNTPAGVSTAGDQTHEIPGQIRDYCTTCRVNPKFPR